MRFLVYEQDLLVRADIFETIKDAFSGAVHLIDDLRDLGDSALAQVEASVVVLSVSGNDMREKSRDVLSFSSSIPVVVICDDLPTHDETCTTAQFVPRPFSSDTLVSAIKSALSSRPKDPS